MNLLVSSAVNKIDLLFMVDNSKSMADKQATLQDAVPELVRRLVTPLCLNDQGVSLGVNADTQGHCREGHPEFKAIRDIHIGVVTSSLGHHGGDQCRPPAEPPSVADDAHLLATLPRAQGLDTNGLGFLNWNPDGGGEADADALIDKFGKLVQSAQEDGCGYEGSLEAWYRFLVDPEPSQDVTVQDGVSVVSGIDRTILEQRAAFLRPDSLVAIVMLTDENDCSVRDETGSYGYWVTTGRLLPAATSACERDPNSSCCRSCGTQEGSPPSGCSPVREDPACQSAIASDPPALRCFDQKRRFGIDLLWPTSRYVNALTKPTVPNARGELVPNPLFEAPAGQYPRAASQVFLAGIVGVPWQDIATAASLAPEHPDELDYLTNLELTAKQRWSVILGNSEKQILPSDPLMHESIAARTGSNPILGVPLAPSTSVNPRENPINGHEADYSSDARDLQYACIYPLPTPEPCAPFQACDCEPPSGERPGELIFNRPLCNPPDGGPAEATQYFAKAYPGLRELEVLHGVGEATDNSIVASICPKVSFGNKRSPAYGYNPAMRSIVDRLKGALAKDCLTRKLRVDETGNVPCTVVETRRAAPGESCGADAALPEGCDESRGRSSVSSALARAVRDELGRGGACGKLGQPACREFCMCAVAPLQGQARERCQNDRDDSAIQSATDAHGYCYVDPDPAPDGQGLGSKTLVQACPETARRRMRFMGENTPASNSITLIACASSVD